jgi:hypothetical protein
MRISSQYNDHDLNTFRLQCLAEFETLGSSNLFQEFRAMAHNLKLSSAISCGAISLVERTTFNQR